MHLPATCGQLLPSDLSRNRKLETDGPLRRLPHYWDFDNWDARHLFRKSTAQHTTAPKMPTQMLIITAPTTSCPSPGHVYLAQMIVTGNEKAKHGKKNKSPITTEPNHP